MVYAWWDNAGQPQEQFLGTYRHGGFLVLLGRGVQDHLRRTSSW
jgi:hypothetical protein